jgi:hypothetical protein
MKKGDLIQFVSAHEKHRCRGIILENVPEDDNQLPRIRIAVYMYYVPAWNNLKSGEIWDIKLSKLNKLYRVLNKAKTN